MCAQLQRLKPPNVCPFFYVCICLCYVYTIVGLPCVMSTASSPRWAIIELFSLPSFPSGHGGLRRPMGVVQEYVGPDPGLLVSSVIQCFVPTNRRLMWDFHPDLYANFALLKMPDNKVLALWSGLLFWMMVVLFNHFHWPLSLYIYIYICASTVSIVARSGGDGLYAYTCFVCMLICVCQHSFSPSDNIESFLWVFLCRGSSRFIALYCSQCMSILPSL